MARHGVAGTPAPAIGARDTAHDDDTAISLVLGRCIQIIAFTGCLGHGRWCVFEGKEGRHGVGFEAFLQVGRGGGVDGGWAEEAGGADPDVEAAPGIESLVDEGESVLFRGDGVGVVDNFGIWVRFGEVGGEAGRGGVQGAGVDAGGAMGCIVAGVSAVSMISQFSKRCW